MNASFVSLKQVDAGVLDVGYTEAGPADGPAVVLLHGWPYDIHSYVEVTPVLAAAGYRVVVPHLRGYGTTRFLSSATFRNGQQSALAVDTIALMDALKIEQAILAGFDWGARTANIVAALWPERCKAMVSVSGYLIGSPEANKRPLPPTAELQWWYQYYFATERGEPAAIDIGTILRSLFGVQLLRNGTSMTLRLIAARRRSTTRIMSASSSITTAGGWDWLRASRTMTIWRSGLPKVRSSPCPRSPLKVMPMVHHTPTAALMPRSSRENMCIV